MLLQQVHIGHRHAAVYGFAHVINREQGDLHGGEGFHLDASLTDGFNERAVAYWNKKWAEDKKSE